MESLKMSVEEAAGILGISPQQIRKIMRDDRTRKEEDKALPIGQARKVIGGKYRRQTYRYDVYRPKVLKYAGLDERMVKEYAK